MKEIQIDEEIKRLRKKIDEIDDSILDFLNKRAEIVIEIGRIKTNYNQEFYVPAREQEIYERLMNRNTGPFPSEAIKSVYREILSASLSLEKPLRIAFLGPKATFTHVACINRFGLSAEYIMARGIPEVFDVVERGGADFGVVPVENSTEGVVNHTLDMFLESNINICGEILLEVSHDLLSKTGRPQDIKRIYSHPHAIAQCRKWLETNMPDIPVIDVASTAAAAQMASEDLKSAAIASEFAALLYDLRVVYRKIEDNINNFTRFLVIGKKIPERTGKDKTSILFSVKDEVGALYRMLEPFAKNNINLTKIESRPNKTKAWDYVFFLDLEGHIEDDTVKRAVDELKERCTFLKILGSYPRVM